MQILFRLSKEIENFSTIDQTKDFFRTLDRVNDNYFYNNRNIRTIKKGDAIFFAYDSCIVAKAIFTGHNIEREKSKNYFNIGYKLKDIEIIEKSEKLNAKIVGTRSIRYLKNKELENEIKRVLSISIPQIAEEINTRAKNFNIGSLQKIRKEINGLDRIASKNIFTAATTKEDWAFHLGGRTELQFNIGREVINNKSFIRFGVAFSLELSMSLPNITPLIPKIALFNDFIQNNLDDYADMKMWHYDSERSAEYQPMYIPATLVKKNVFIFLGIRQHIDSIDYDIALSTMDRLFPLYLYIEHEGNTESREINKAWQFEFSPRIVQKKSSTKASLVERELDIKLRHNDIQQALYKELVLEYGKKNVGTEVQSGYDNSVDMIVKHIDGYHFYEIKTAHTAKSCIRQALGQLLEYSYWPNNKEAILLIIVGEPDLDDEARDYLKTLNEKFTLPLDYKSIKIV